jgi:hypothetical protein
VLAGEAGGAEPFEPLVGGADDRRAAQSVNRREAQQVLAPGEGSPPGNRSGTYPVCGRPVTRPDDGRDTPATTRSSVDFPEPFRPSTRISRPASTSAETPRTTQGCRGPYRLPTASSRVIASATKRN